MSRRTFIHPADLGLAGRFGFTETDRPVSFCQYNLRRIGSGAEDATNLRNHFDRIQYIDRVEAIELVASGLSIFTVTSCIAVTLMFGGAAARRVNPARMRRVFLPFDDLWLEPGPGGPAPVERAINVRQE
jgi:hypothetical protein